MSRGMSSELQAIMQRRLARCEEVPADEQMQDEKNISENFEQDRETTQLAKSTNDDNMPNKMEERKTDQKEEDDSMNHPSPATAAKRFQSASSSFSMHASRGASLSTSASVSSAQSSRTIQSQTQVSKFKSLASTNDNKDSPTSNIGTSLNLKGRDQNRDEDSPFDEKSPRQSNIYQKTILKKTKANLNKDSYTDNNTGSNNNSYTSRGFTATMRSTNIQKHPYLKRYSPTNLGKPDPKPESKPESKPDTKLGMKTFITETEKIRNQFKSLDRAITIDNNKNSNSIEKRVSPPSRILDNINSIEKRISPPSGILHNDNSNEKISTSPTFRNLKNIKSLPTFKRNFYDNNSSEKATSPTFQDLNEKSLSPQLAIPDKNNSNDRKSSPLLESLNESEFSESTSLASFQKSVSKSKSNEHISPISKFQKSISKSSSNEKVSSPIFFKKQMKEKEETHQGISKDNGSSVEPTPISKSSQRKTTTSPLMALSVSHVTAMKKLFTYTNPPPPPTTTPPNQSKKLKSPRAKSKEIKTSKESMKSTSLNSSSSSTDEIEITIDSFKTTVKDKENEKGDNKHVEKNYLSDAEHFTKEEYSNRNQFDDEIKNVDSGKKSSSHSNSFFGADVNFDLMKKEDEEEKTTSVENVEMNFQGPKLESMSVFESFNDWSGTANIETTMRASPKEMVAQSLNGNQPNFPSVAPFESNGDWPNISNGVMDQESLSFAPAFDQHFPKAGKDTLDWSSKSDNSTMKQNPSQGNVDPFSSTSFFQFGNFGPSVEEERDDDILIIEDEFEGEPEINVDRNDDRIILKSIPITKSLSYDPIGSVKNPLTGNLVICHQRNGNQWYIDEIDPHTSSVIASAHISTSNIRHKIISSVASSDAATYLKRHIICGIDRVLKISIGLHRQHNRSRARVAAIMNLKVLGGGKSGSSNSTLCIIAVWQWGYAASGSTIVLQNVISTPPKNCFEPKSLCIADGLVFLAGSSETSSTTANDQSYLPVIYIAKPHVRDFWSMNKLKEGLNSSEEKVVFLSITPYSHRSFKLLALGLGDGSISIWSYEKAVLTNRSISSDKHQQGGTSNNQQLQLFCKLEGSSCLTDIEPTILTSCYEDKDQSTSQNDEKVSCCHMSWITSCRSSSASILLAVAFTNGVAIYFVPTKRETSNIIKPITVTKIKHIHQSCRVAWIEIPTYPPCLSILFSGSTKSIMIYGLLGVPLHGCEDENPIKIQLNTICEHELQIRESLPWADMFMIGMMKSIISCNNGDITMIIPSSQFQTRQNMNSIHPALFTLFQPIASNPPGVTSLGLVENKSANDDVLHLHSQLHWERFCDNHEKSLESGNCIPFLRQWLCLTNVGDKKNLRKYNQKQYDESFPTGGAFTELICELKCKGDSSHPSLTPKRVVRDSSGKLCAVLFSPLVTLQDNMHRIEMECDPTNFSIFRLEHEKRHEDNILNLQFGRDVIFPDDNSEQKFFCLDKDGINLEERSVSNTSNESPEYKTRIFRKGSAYDEKLESHRLFLISSHHFLLLASRKEDSRYLLLLGGEINILGAQDECLINEKKSKLWLNEGERLVSLIELPSTDANINIAISTTSRILIIRCDSNLEIIAQCEHNSVCSSLAPLGSYCVSFLIHEANKTKIQYLSYLKNDPVVGTITNLPTNHVHHHNLLLALRPDRIVYNSIFTEIEHHEECTIKLPLTKPIFLLEPLIANAIGESQGRTNEKNDNASCVLDSLLERFGVKMDSIPHNEHEGIGTKGVGFTSLVYQMLRDHGYGDSISNHLNRGRNLMPWIQTTHKIHESGACEEVLHTLSDGDNYLSEYLRNADINKSCVLPKPIDPLAHVLAQYSYKSLSQNKMDNAIKTMDLLGSPSSYHDLASIFLVLQLSPMKRKVNAALSKLGSHNVNSPATLPFDHSLQKALKHAGGEQKQDETMQFKKNMPQLTPFYQSGICQTRRTSNHLINHSVIHSIKQNEDQHRITQNTDDRNHVWNCGPFHDKEELLLLDRIEEWVGRCRPSILGKEGAEVAAESGTNTLKKILDLAAADERVLPEDDSDDINSQCSAIEGWVDNVGEGQSDEEKLTLYLRFFEGADEDSKWKIEGLSDLSSFQNKPMLIQPEIFDIEATSSNVDEGESGTVRLLHDLVVHRDISSEEVAGLFLEVKRGSSLDTGMFHSDNNQSRQRATLEFWFYLPKTSEEIVLARRSACFQNGEDIESLCCKKEKESMIWELVVLPSGRLEFRSSSGDTLNTSMYSNPQKRATNISNDDSDDENTDAGLVSWPRKDGYGGWNHVCLTFCCRNLERNECKVTIAMKGIEVVSSVMKLQLPVPSLDQEGSLDVDDALSISALMFGIGAIAGFRITELRVWAYARPLADVKRMMCEYLDVAKMKKKLRVSIRGQEKRKKVGGILIPPRGIDKPTKLVAPKEKDRVHSRKFEMSEQTDNESSFFQAESSFADFDSSFNKSIIEFNTSKIQDDKINESTAVTFQNNLENSEELQKKKMPDLELEEVQVSDAESASGPSYSYKAQESSLLSEYVRKSAAAALIRGGPATRHFGGNRGGLPAKLMNIGSISICGAQKTVILSHGRTPRGKTYPIGASGAIISDLMNVGGSEEIDEREFLCTFLAKDKRMVVFDLKSKKVIVELQMTTKLNFWRFLPPIVHGENLTFLLITPAGGFHWLPLSKSQRPRQVWKRGAELQGKKIVSYEEGGSNGLRGEECLSSVALVLTCTSTASDPVEAWCITLHNESQHVCVSPNVLGAALFCTPSMLLSTEAFKPLLVLATAKNNGILVELFTPFKGSLGKESMKISEMLEFSHSDEVYEVPTMAMGSSPSVICLCWNKFVVIIVRDRGLMVYYEFDKNTLNLIFKHNFKRYVVDAGIQSHETGDGVEIAALVCEIDRKDGKIVTLHLKD